jgi:hypothetical protein
MKRIPIRRPRDASGVIDVLAVSSLLTVRSRWHLHTP